MRLAPIERPDSLLVRIAYWMSKRQLGAVMSPMKVLYARVPRILRTTLSIIRTTESLSLDPALRLLITTQSSLLNGCTFCADLHMAQAVQAKLGRERFRELLDFRTSPHFSERERAALAYTEEVTRERKAGDATFERLRAPLQREGDRRAHLAECRRQLLQPDGGAARARVGWLRGNGAIRRASVAG